MVSTIDEVTNRLKEWIGAIAPNSRCSVKRDGDGPHSEIQLDLLRIVPGNRPRDATSALEIRLEYLCAVTSGDALADQRTVGEIAFAVLASTDYEIAKADCGGAAVVICTRLTRARELRSAPRVRAPLRTTIVPNRLLQGVLVNPANIGIAGAVVALPGTNQRCVTDENGHFSLAATGQGDQKTVLEVYVKGKIHRVVSAIDGTSTATPRPFLLPTENQDA